MNSRYKFSVREKRNVKNQYIERRCQDGYECDDIINELIEFDIVGKIEESFNINMINIDHTLSKNYIKMNMIEFHIRRLLQSCEETPENIISILESNPEMNPFHLYVLTGLISDLLEAQKHILGTNEMNEDIFNIRSKILHKSSSLLDVVHDTQKALRLLQFQNNQDENSVILKSDKYYSIVTGEERNKRGW